MSSVSEVRNAIRRLSEGAVPAAIAESLIHQELNEYSGGRPMSALGRAALLIGGVALTGHGLSRIFGNAARTSNHDVGGRAVLAMLGGALDAGSRILSHRITGAAVNLMGGPQAIRGQGNQIRYSWSFNVPPPTVTREVSTTRGGGSAGSMSGHSRSTTTTRLTEPNPLVPQAQFARFEADPTAEGYIINLYRETPQGLRMGAPLKTFNVSFKGMTPMSIRRVEDSITRSIVGLGQALIHNKRVRMPPQRIPAGPGRPPKRRLRR